MVPLVIGVCASLTMCSGVMSLWHTLLERSVDAVVVGQRQYEHAECAGCLAPAVCERGVAAAPGVGRTHC
jgi:hypothetical protein